MIGLLHTPKIQNFNIIYIALEIVFGSLYLDEVSIDPKSVISVLATATLFQLDSLIDRCAEVMTETVNAEVNITILAGSRFVWFQVCFFNVFFL